VSPEPEISERVNDAPTPAPSRPTPAAGVRVGERYVVEAEIGAGGMGRVLRARDERLNRQVAIKLMRDPAASETWRMRFEQEARAAAAVQHPNIVVVHDVGLHEGLPFVVQELLRGEPLRSRLRLGKLNPPEALEIALQIARGLAAAHARGIVHRDLKPDNVFLCEDGTAKILDFGIAKIDPPANDPGTLGDSPPPLTRTGEVLGTHGYMSPEQVQGLPASAPSDVFNLGTVLHEMLSGQPAFRAESNVERAYAILRGKAQPLPDEIDPAIQQVVERCLRKVPADRFQSAKDVAFALEALARGRAQRTPRPRSWRRRTAALLALLAAGALGAVARGVTWRSAPTAAPVERSMAERQMIALAATGTDKAPALDAFRDGEALLRRGDWKGAQQAFQRAVKLDPAFALAQYRLSVASYDEPGLAADSVRRALKLAKAGSLERRLAEGYQALLTGETASALELYRQLLEAAPDLVEAWVHYADTMVHYAPYRGASIEEAVDALSRALLLDPGEPHSLKHALDFAEQRGFDGMTAQLAARLLADGSADAGFYYRWTRLSALGEAAQLQAALGEVRSGAVSAGDVVVAWQRANWHRDGLDGSIALARALSERPARNERAQGLRLLAFSSWARGQPRHALALLDDALALRASATMAFERAWLISRWDEATEADLLAARKAALAIDTHGTPRIEHLARHVAGVLSLRLGDHEQVARLAGQLEQSPRFEGSSLTTDLALSLRALQAKARGDGAGALALLSQMKFLYPYSTTTTLSRLPEQLLRAELLEDAGKLPEAAAWLDSTAFHGPYEVLFRAPTLERQARVFLKLGRRDRAHEALRMLRDLWRECEPSFLPKRQKIAEELERLAAR
jgi:tetratricopeptide (TPR) repeat protein